MDCGACVCTRARAHSCRAVNVLKVPARRTCAVRTRSRGSKSARSICWTKQAAPRKAAPVTRRHAGCAPSTGRTDSALSSGAAPPWSAADSAKSTVRTPTLLLRGRCPESHASAVCKRVCAVRGVSLPLLSLPRCLFVARSRWLAPSCSSYTARALRRCLSACGICLSASGLCLWSLVSASASLSLALDGWRRRARATLHVRWPWCAYGMLPFLKPYFSHWLHVSTGAKGICSMANCNTAAAKKGRCAKHGGGKTKICHVAGCSTVAAARGVCGKHGAYRRCSYMGCSSNAELGFLHCSSHSALDFDNTLF